MRAGRLRDCLQRSGAWSCKRSSRRQRHEEPRAGADRKLTSNEEALLIATACSSPPEGRARWTLELLASAMVKLTDHDSLSRETVRRRLAENHLKPWQKDTWCIPKVDAEYVGSTRRRWPVAIAASSDRAAALAHAVDGDGHVERALAHRHGRYGEIPGSGGGRPSD